MFDLDGTLLDTIADLHQAANAMLTDAGLPTLAIDVVKSYVGRGLPNLVRRCLTGARNGVAPAQDECDAMVTRFRAHYRQINGIHARVYPGVIEALKSLQSAGIPMACVTNKSAEFAEPLLAQTGLAPYFQCIISGDTLAHKKPHPQPLLHVCKIFNVRPEEVLMVGDSQNDIGAARAAGCPVMCVPYGYNEGVPLSAQDCDALVPTLLHATAHLDLSPAANARSLDTRATPSP